MSGMGGNFKVFKAWYGVVVYASSYSCSEDYGQKCVSTFLGY